MELKSLLRDCPNGSACGKDEIYNEMVKILDEDNLSRVLEVFNLSWSTGTSPTCWRTGVIVPIHKSGKPKKEMESYRPVTLLSVLSKMLERLICTRLRFLLESKGLLAHEQAGFRKSKSTMDPLLSLTDKIQRGFQQNGSGDVTMAVFLDLSRAFDRVDHQVLLAEFINLGIPPCYCKWFRSFLCDRRNGVRYEDEFSDFVRFAAGVPQGSVCGPLLFLIYINTLIVRLSVVDGLDMFWFADDGSFAVTGPQEWCRGQLQEALHICFEWCPEFKMTFSAAKSLAMVFSLSKGLMDPVLKLGSATIPVVKSVKLLGVILDQKLTFDDHVASLKKHCDWALHQMHCLTGTTWGSFDF